jgi:polyhydroxyalkanoate synthase
MLNSQWSRHNKVQAEIIDRSFKLAISKFTGGISPAAFLLAFFDWYIHLLIHLAKQIELIELYQNNVHYLVTQYVKHLYGETSDEYGTLTSSSEKRFTHESWQKFPYSVIYESFLLIQQWWHTAATKVRGVSHHHEEVVDFTFRQVLDMLSPSNFILTNPEVQQATITHKGNNFIRGLENVLDDVQRSLTGQPPAGAEQYVIGKNIANSVGKVIYRNQLIELIQYAPLTEKVYTRPILITPAWIMKYYILDLSPKHSLIKYLVKKGHTVFIISWKNPTKKEKNLGMEDYLNLGILSSLDIINTIMPEKKIHLIGYCLGGTLSAIAAAAMARDDDNRLASMTLLATLTDFTEPGELGLFIDASQISFLESIMQDKGYLDRHQMAGAFQLLRSNDLIWSRLVHDYLLGTRKPLTDLMAWNADATRMPYKMHSEYLRKLFLRNELAKGSFMVKNEAIALTDISIPMFVVSTERDHVSPWRSVFKINLLTDGEVTFVLTSGGHNVGIVSLPTTKRHYRISTLKENDRFIDAETWYKKTPPIRGSWWPALESWITKHSDNSMSPPPPMGCGKKGLVPLEDAPGTYVLEK